MKFLKIGTLKKINKKLKQFWIIKLLTICLKIKKISKNNIEIKIKTVN